MLRARDTVRIVLATLLLAAILDGAGLAETAAAQPFGWHRRAALALARPLATVGRFTGLGLPRAIVHALLRDVRAEPMTLAASRVSTSAPTPLPAPTPAPASVPAATAQSAAPRGGGRRAEPAPQIPRDVSLWTAGDSVSGHLGLALRRRGAEQGFGAEAEYRVSTGLCRPDVYNWPLRIEQETARLKPRAVVLLFGANDDQGIRDGQHAHQFGTDEWRAAYARRVTELMQRLVRDGREVYWVGQPVMRDGGFGDRMRVLNAIYAGQAAHTPGVTYVDAWTLFSGEDGRYADYLPDEHGRLVKVREGDGIHLTGAGGDRLAAEVLRAIAARRAPPPPPPPPPAPPPSPSSGPLPSAPINPPVQAP